MKNEIYLKTNYEIVWIYKEVCLRELYPNKNYFTEVMETFKVREQTINNLSILNKKVECIDSYTYKNDDIYKYTIELKYTSYIDNTVEIIESLWFISIYPNLDDIEIKILSMYILNSKNL